MPRSRLVMLGLVALVCLSAGCRSTAGDLTAAREDDRPVERQKALLRLADRAGAGDLSPARREEARKVFLAACDDPSSLVRSAAAHGLGVAGGDGAVQRLADLASGDTEDYVRSDALVALANLVSRGTSDPDASEAGTLRRELERVLADDPAHLVRRQAVELVAGMATDPAGIETAEAMLTPLLHDSDPGIQFVAKQALDRIRAGAPPSQERP